MPPLSTDRYSQGYQAGWDRRNAGRRARYPKRYVAAKTAEFQAGFEAGWRDGEGRGQTFAQFQVQPNPPQPRSWREYEA